MKWCVILLAACTPVLPPPATEQDALRVHIALVQLDAGRNLLLKRCGSCHDVPVPGQRAAKDWPRQVALMQVRAGIDASQRALIEQYLVAMAPK